MSLSKGQRTVTATAASGEPRTPKCTRCRHHGIVVPQKGHMKYCPFLRCDCWKCYLITQRTRITALQRNLQKAQRKPRDEARRPRDPAGVSVGKPAAQGTSSGLAPDGGARPSATSVLMCPPPAGAPGSATTSTWSPLDIRSRPAAGGERVAGMESKEVPYTSSEEEPCSPFSAPYFSEMGQAPPLPVIHFPFRMSGHCSSSYAPHPNFMFHIPWIPPVPAGLYNNGLCGPQILPHFQQGALHYPPPPEPGPQADCRQVFFTLQPSPLPEAFQEGSMPRQHPQPPLPQSSDPDIEELD